MSRANEARRALVDRPADLRCLLAVSRVVTSRAIHWFSVALGDYAKDEDLFRELLRRSGPRRPMRLLQIGLLRSPSNVSMLAWTAKIAHGMEDFVKSGTFFTRAAIADAHDVDLRLRASGVLFHNEEFTNAMVHARAATSLDPGNPEAWFWLGRILWASGAYSEAEKVLRKSARRDPLYRQRAIIVMQGVGPQDFKNST